MAEKDRINPVFIRDISPIRRISVLILLLSNKLLVHNGVSKAVVWQVTLVA